MHMVMSPTTLGGELANMVPTDQEIEAIQTFADAWEKYMGGSAAGPVPAVPGSFAGAKGSMIGAMSGISTTGATAIAAGIAAFWGVVATSAATIWPPALSATPPPGLSGIAAVLAAVLVANTVGELSLVDATNAMAAAMHPANLGGIAVFPPLPGGLGPQPIL